MLPHIRGRPVTMERYPAGIGEKGFWQKDVSKGFPEWLRARRGAEEGRRRAPSARHRRAIAALAGQPEHASRRTSGRRARRICITPTSASSISIRRRTSRTSLRAAALGAARPARRARAAELGQDVRLEGLPHRRAARRQDAGSDEVAALRACRRRAAREARSGAPHAGVQQGRPRRPHLRRHRAQRLQRDVRRGLRRAREARRAGVGAVHVGGDRARRRSARRRSRCGPWPRASARSATCGPTCGAAVDR